METKNNNHLDNFRKIKEYHQYVEDSILPIEFYGDFYIGDTAYYEKMAGSIEGIVTGHSSPCIKVIIDHPNIQYLLLSVSQLENIS